MTYSNYVKFSVLVSSICFSKKTTKKQLLYLRWLFAGLLWYLTEDLYLLGLFGCNIGLATKCVMVKVLDNVIVDELLPQT